MSEGVSSKGILDDNPRVCVIGAGAMGGLIGGHIAGAGIGVTLVDRDARTAQLRRDGLRLITPSGETRHYPGLRVVDSVEAAGPHEIVILAVKTYDLAAAVKGLRGTLGPDTVVVTVQNGIPWWYFHKQGGRLDGLRLRTVDADGSLEREIDSDRVIACIPYPAAEVLPNGVVKHVEGFKLPVGELDGRDTPRARRVSAVLEAAGFKSRLLDDVRSETWLKAWGNLAFNPISALTGATLEGICRFAPTRDLAAAMMREAQEVAEAVGARFRVGVEQRIQGAEAVGPHKTSMLQDLEAGRRLETDALVGAVIEIAEALAIETPSIRAVYAAVLLLGHTRLDERSESPVRERLPVAAPAVPSEAA